MAELSTDFRRRLNTPLAFAVAVAIGVCGCFSTEAPTSTTKAGLTASPASRRTTHTVLRGETIYRIAHEYGVTTEGLMEANGLSDPRELRVGQLLTIPRGGIRPSAATASALGDSPEWTPARADRQFAWPVLAGVVSSPFGIRNGVMHEGVDIAAPVGTPVNAADDGTVIYTGELHGYGNVVIVQHSGGYVTVYGHNRRNLVHDGQHVVRGEQIGEIGTSGRTSGPNLHFEVRYDNHAQNPLAYLPAPESATGISFARYSGSQYR